MIQTTLLNLPQTEKTGDDFYTPEWLFDALGLRFALDVASPEGGVPWVPADRYFAMSDDGLSQEWSGRVWMNPPFSRPEPWVNRFIEHGDGIALIPASNGGWFVRLWESADAIAIPGVKPLQFVGGGIPIRCLLAAFGADCVEAIGRVGRVR